MGVSCLRAFPTGIAGLSKASSRALRQASAVPRLSGCAFFFGTGRIRKPSRFGIPAYGDRLTVAAAWLG